MSSLSTPKCPLCGSPMTAANRRDNGVCFWGCSRYPACRGSRPMASLGEQVRDAGKSLGGIIRALRRLLGRR